MIHNNYITKIQSFQHILRIFSCFLGKWKKLLWGVEIFMVLRYNKKVIVIAVTLRMLC